MVVDSPRLEQRAQTGEVNGMAYPDFTTSAAPNFARDILGVVPTFNEMANQNARTQIARQQQATSAWLAEIERARKAQEIAMAPQIQARQEELARSEIAARNQQITASRNQMNREALRDPYILAAAEKEKSDRDAAESDDKAVSAYLSEAQAISPDEFAEGGADTLRSKYLPQLHEPKKLYQAEHEFLAGNETYAHEMAKTKFSSDALDSYNLTLGKGGSKHEAMENGLQVMRAQADEQKTALEASNSYQKAFGKAQGENDGGGGPAGREAKGMTGPEETRAKGIIEMLTANDPEYKKLSKEAQLMMHAAAEEAVINSRKTNGTIDQAKIFETLKLAKEDALGADKWKAQNDRRFNFLRK